MNAIPSEGVPQSICRFSYVAADITPPVGMYHRMWAASSHDRSQGVHRPLRAGVMAFAKRVSDSESTDSATDSANTQLVMTADHCLLATATVKGIIDAVSRATSLDPRAIHITFSHTHGVGWIANDRAHHPGGELIEPYLESLIDTYATLAQEAHRSLQPASIVYGTGRCNLAVNRDQWHEPTQQWVIGYNTDVPADDTVMIARVSSDNDGRTLANIVNYACHPTTLAWENRLISPDYVGAMRETVEDDTGAPCVFLYGAAGELGPRVGFVGDVQVADRNGRQLGLAALSTLTTMPPHGTQFENPHPVVSGATLAPWRYAPMPPARHDAASTWHVKRSTCALPYRADQRSLDEVIENRTRLDNARQQARSVGDKTRAADLHALIEREDRTISCLEDLPPGDAYPCETTVLRIGDAIWVSVPGEPYSVLQTTLRDRFDCPILLMTLSEGWWPTYLPSEDMYGKGMYAESITLLAPGSLELMIEHVAGQIQRCLEYE